MECVWRTEDLRKLPEDLQQVIQHGSNERYLESFAQAALDARYTYLLLAQCDDLFAQVCATLRSHGSFASSVATVGRILQFVPHLKPCVIRLLEAEQYSLGRGQVNENLSYLLGLYRLLRVDHRIFRKFVNARDLTLFLGRGSRAVTYLIIRILQIFFEGADAWFEATLKQYLGEDSSEENIDGVWDDKIIDYRFITLWEEDRVRRVSNFLAQIRSSRDDEKGLGYEVRRTLPQECFDSSVVLIGGALLPREKSHLVHHGDKLVETKSVIANIRSLTSTLKSPRPVLLSGLAGSGKSYLVRYVASNLGKLDKMVTLHLNEQSDAKLLLGIYTTGEEPGSFKWKPGVLTTAVREGRWILIEDLDRTPIEVLGTLLPLIEKRQLFVPNRKETIYAAEGFRILATVRSSINHKGDNIHPLTQMLGLRHWQQVQVEMPSAAEHASIAENLFPSLEKLLPQFIAVYKRLMAASNKSTLSSQSRTGVARLLGPRDLLKWCQRVCALLTERTSFTDNDIHAIYLEAIDCFVGALPDDSIRLELASLIAEELHIDPQTRDFLLSKREAQYYDEKSRLIVGRYTLPKVKSVKGPETSFSTNPQTTRMLERVSAAVSNREPLLLVGETGVGKTTAVQHLAARLGKKLIPFNLSQQSEAGDLLGGFKPVDAHSLVIPLKDEFDELFQESFSLTKNQQFLELLSKQVRKNSWKPVCKLWRQALSMVDQQRSASPPREGEAPSKKRKVGTKKTIDFARWDNFAMKVDNLDKKLTKANNAIAFTFVEGNIVKAVRNGDWVLLDEINLASPDTLESIADLLDPTLPSLLLTEAGDIERIQAHPEFRVFAAMNPATDVGKKDLPPGIRSRFTELYVESPDKDIKSLESIVQAYLRQETINDTSIAHDVSRLYQKILDLSGSNRLVDGAGQKPHFSLRTLTRTLSYARRIQKTCDLRRALYEGFHMSFLTLLDIESAQLVEPLIEQHLFPSSYRKGVGIRKDLLRPLKRPDDGHAYVVPHPNSVHWIRQGSQPLQDQDHYIITPFVQNNLENLVRAASTRQFPVLIQGPTSSGKTSMIEYLAKRTGHIFTRINNHEHTDIQEYLGTYVSGTDGRIRFQEGVLVKALRKGHWIVLDELNLAPTDVLEALNRLLDDNRELLIPETQELVRPHPDFMLFATQNPAGLYGGRKTLSRAFRNRFLELHFDDIPVDELEVILHRRTQLPASRARRIVNVYKELSVLRQQNRLFEQKSFATLRDLFRWASRQNDTIEQLATNGFMLLCERVRNSEERLALKNIIEEVMSSKGPRVRIDEDKLYAQDCEEIQQHVLHVEKEGVVWTRAMRRLYILVSKAVRNKEPVLLVGETGCGKTTVCQMLADATRKHLYTVNAHQNTETGDLVGSHRPVRNRSAIETSLRQLLFASPLLRGVGDNTNRPTEELLTDYDQALASEDREQRETYLRTEIHADIQTMQGRFRQLFEWCDGALVTSMKQGDFFLLDEISLAEDSVLERLNSVLESQRTVLLAEKGSLDSSVTAADGFQFFATMNPGGDYGKRELSPALRNRFTEIWVPSLSDLDDVLQIVRSKLVEHARPLAGQMVDFAIWFKKRYDTSASSSVSIRDTLAWVEFVNASSSPEILSSVVHGAAMVYIDTLGANPAGLLSLTSQRIDDERNACLMHLGELLRVDGSACYGQSFEVRTDNSCFRVGSYGIPCVHGTPTKISFTFEPHTTRLNSMKVLRALQLNKPILLEGSPGVGKTALVTAISGAIGMPLTRINLSDQTDLFDIFGSDAPVEGAQTGTFVWRDAPFLRAMKTGEWVLLDEMNLASQSVLEGLNACLDHRGEVFIPELDQAFPRHPDFRVFATQNPHHQGGGRKGLPASFVNRFTVVYADSFKVDDLKLICQQSFPKLESEDIETVVRFVTELNDEVSKVQPFGSGGGPWEFNLRDVARWLSLASSDEGLLAAGSPRDFYETLFRQRFRTENDRICVNTLFNSTFSADSFATDLFCNISTQTLQVGLGILQRNTLKSTPQDIVEGRDYTSKHLRILQSIMLCIQQCWPVVLVGPSGVGKTTIIERLAACVGADIVTLAMSTETDGLDLIGGYEQCDPYRRISQVIAAVEMQCYELCKLGLLNRSNDKVNGLLKALEEMALSPHDSNKLEKLVQSFPTSEQSETRLLLEILHEGVQAIDKARFQWVDGPLIEALQQGKWLIIDNANLCSASVLDRLNSLLEPNGALVVHENPSENGTPRVIQPHPSFRIFLAVDPKLGELSRAMRNRAVELYMSQSLEKVAPLTDPLYTESCMSRLRILNYATDVSSSNDLITLSSHLAITDQRLMSRMLRQLANGLLRQTTLDEPSGVLEGTLPSHAEVSELKNFYEEITSSMQAPADLACAQTLHPLINQPLIQCSTQSFPHALVLATKNDFRLALFLISRALTLVSSNSETLTKLTRSWKALRKEFGTLATAGSNNPLDFISKMLQPIQMYLQPGAWTATDMSETKATLQSLLSFCWVCLETFHSPNLDFATLTACNMVGRTIVEEALVRSPHLSSTIASYYSGISQLGPRSAGHTGYAYATFWEALRPTLPATLDELDALISFERVVERFDREVSGLHMPLKQIVDLRLRFQRALKHGVSAGANLDELAQKALALMPHQISNADTGPDAARPHFVSSFERLCQHFGALALQCQPLQPDEMVALESLALRRTVDGVACRQTSDAQSPEYAFHFLAFISHAAGRADEARQTIGRGIIQELTEVRQVNLRDSLLLEAENRTLGRTIALKGHFIAADVLPAFDTCLRTLLGSILRSLSTLNSEHSLPRCALDLLHALGGSEHNSLLSTKADDPHGLTVQRLAFVVRHLNARSPGLSSAAAAWSAFAKACLDLFVPAQLFDPLQQVQMERAVFDRTKEDLESRLFSVQKLGQVFVGEQNSLRSRLLENEILALGRGPPMLKICRPLQPQLAQLHMELQNLVRLVRSLDDGNVTGSAFDQGAWTNLRIIRARLCEQFRVYADITFPVVGFVDCLAIAQRLETQAVQKLAVEDREPAIGTITPFVDAGAPEWLSDEHFLRVRSSCARKEDQIFWLSVLAARSSILPMSKTSQTLRLRVNETFRGFYESWKIEFGRDQKIAAAKSSLYQYRGDDDEDEDEIQQAGINELFPDSDPSIAYKGLSAKPPPGIQTLALKISELFHAMNSPTELKPSQILELVQHWTTLPEDRAGLTEKGSHLTATLHALHQLNLSLSTSQPKRRNHNIYKDANFGQSKVLRALVTRVQARFTAIHDSWPEHATPVEVLRVCEQILSLSCLEPIALYLPSIEKLHATINEWQIVASSEYSASTLLEDTVNLIVSWRQIELSTWAGMFDSETEQCKQKAASWWFIAYETIIEPCEEVQWDAVSFSTFAKQLIETLASFLSNCGLGEYPFRLRLLADFEVELAKRSKENSGFATLREALASLISFYTRYEESVADTLAKRRNELEKDIKNVIQLASWKDRNIETLRNSANASHKKLFRVVLKYRQLLSEPVTALLQVEFPLPTYAKDGRRDKPRGYTFLSGPYQPDPRSLPLQTWIERAPYLTDVPALVKEMETRSINMQGSNTTSERIEKFLCEVEAEISELQKETPKTATEENKTFIQHLKTRKRRLLADVLKDVRIMGFSTNIGVDVWAQQASLAIVLARSPPLTLYSAMAIAETADQEFHGFARMMPSVSDGSIKHSEDLTAAEIGRSKVLLESMLQMALEQRALIVRHLKGLAILRHSLDEFNGLVSSKCPSVCKVRVDVQSQILLLRNILQTCLLCIEMQSNLGGKDYCRITQSIDSDVSELNVIHTELQELGQMPLWIDSEAKTKIHTRFVALSGTVTTHVQEAIAVFPELRPSLIHVPRWISTSIESGHSRLSNESGETIHTWSQSLLNVSDRAQSSVLATREVLQDTRPQKAWLLRQQTRFLEDLQNLGLEDVSNGLKALMDHMHDLSFDANLSLPQLAIACQNVKPILETYCNITQQALSDIIQLHTMTSKMGRRLSTSFVQLRTRGFCQPPERAENEEKQNGQAESGTGLGEGEGGEDISKDIGNDEDLSELAQEASSKEQEGETEAEKDAVDMADEELEGKFDDAANSEDDGNSEAMSETNVDEEVGHVDDSKDNVRDEKSWDDKQSGKAEKEADNAKGTRSEDVSGADEGVQEASEEGSEDLDNADQDDVENEVAKDEEPEHQQPENADSHMENEQNLELPEDLDMDRDKQDMDDLPGDDLDMSDDVSDTESDGPREADREPEDATLGEEETENDHETMEARDAEDEQISEHGSDSGSDVAMLDKPEPQIDPVDGLVEADGGQGQQQQDEAQAKGGISTAERVDNDNDADESNEQTGTAEGGNRSQQNISSKTQASNEDKQTLPFKQLGDMLKQWYDQQRHIEAAQHAADSDSQTDQDMDMDDARFEHTDEAEVETQALGAAKAEQSRALDDQNAVPIEQEQEEMPQKAVDSDDRPSSNEAEENITGGSADETSGDTQAQKDKAMVGAPHDNDMDFNDRPVDELDTSEMDSVDEQLTNTHLTREQPQALSVEEARRTWSEHESRTRHMAIVLTEHLRLILHPTQATKMRGDFRTGKRLNIKKIIPYIASSYKRDKIWMRRSIPSKRSYQIMLAIDDSESMRESERKALAFETLALVAKSMAMLEIGELSIVGFGERVHVAHGFDMPFTSDAGADVFRQFTFSQSKTDVKRLLRESLTLFREARSKATGSTSNLWQLQLIISDGLCQDHPGVRQLVRQAHDEQIMVVFIVVDSGAQETGAMAKQSIVDLQTAEFLNGEVEMVKYMDTFPFQYYLIVRDVLELPGVLAGALRQWFSEVVDTGS